MRMSLRKRALVSLGLALSFVAGAAAPANAAYYAANDTVRAANRPRSGASTWVPRNIDFQSGWDSSTHNTYMTFGFEWHQNEHLEELEGSSHTLEISAEVDCAWARTAPGLGDPPSGKEGYAPYGFVTNIPAAALPHEDTAYLEPCLTSNSSGRGDYGLGILNAAALVPNTFYWATVTLDNPHDYPSAPPSQSSVKLRVATGTVKDASGTFGIPAQLGEDCDFSDTEITNWLTQSLGGLSKRLEAAWCTWQDWNHTFVKEGGSLDTGEYGDFWLNGLYNQGMGDGGVGLSGYSLGSGNSGTTYCNDNTWPAYDGVCFVQFNKGSAGYAQMWQDTSVNPVTMPYTAEAALRCRNGSSCLIAVGYYGTWNSTEGRGAYAIIPDDGQWYNCRVDYDSTSNRTAPTGYTNDGSAFSVDHDGLRWQLWMLSSGNLDVDYTFMGGKTNRDDPAIDGAQGVGTVGYGSTCTSRY